MMKGNISEIIKRYLAGRFSPATEERIQQWIIKDENKAEKEQASFAYWNELDIEPDAKAYSALERVNKKIGFPREQKRLSWYKQYSRIAAVLIPIFIKVGGYLYYESTKYALIEVVVGYGEEKHLFLPDSSEIWMNAGTTVKYPATFDKGQRTVYLSGEAYFSVKKDTGSPFTVQASNLSVKVLGTKFNVKAYPDERKTTTTLTSGKIEVNTTLSGESRILSPNEQLTFDNKTSKISIAKVSSDESASWVSGQIIFTNTSFKEILHTLERRFNVSFDATEVAVWKDESYTVKFLKDDSLEHILDILKEVSGGFLYQREGDKISIMSNNKN
jgi:ferric-dicitrate binding protein FerR (iron transport regulator)